jgi:glycosyltransferase involved in cell wall biosynthesis
VKVLLVPFCYHPDAVGGTEVYVEALAHGLKSSGVEAIVAAPGNQSGGYEHAGIPVRRFKVTELINDPAELYGIGDELAAREFDHILEQEQPDVVHLHAFTRGVSLRTVRAAKDRKLPVLFTYHTPTVTCGRGTLVRWGSEICSGEMLQSVCTACALHGHGLNRLAAQLLAGLPSWLGTSFGRRGLKSGVWTAVRMTEFVQLHQRCVRSVFDEVDHVVAVCQWAKDLLQLNGVSKSKITLSRQGLPCAEQTENEKVIAETSEDSSVQRSFGLRASGTNRDTPLRIAFVGRLDPVKGPDVLVRAFRRASGLKALLDIYGVSQGEKSNVYRDKLIRMASGDARVRFQSPVPAAQVVPLLRSYDVLAVPSQGLETGPLVVLESFAARVPVLGSNLGGIAELVTDGIDGLLVEPGSIDAWAAALEKLAGEPDLLSRLRRGIRPPRNMATVTGEMKLLYQRFASEQQRAELHSHASC